MIPAQQHPYLPRFLSNDFDDSANMSKTFDLTRLLGPLAFVGFFLVPATAQPPAGQPEPLKVLLVAGGCCHDYSSQAKILKGEIEKRIHAVVTVELSESKSTKTVFEIYEADDWADGYDVVIHDECSANVTEKPYVARILASHRAGMPAVNLHCAMHSYRWGDYRQPVESGADNAGWYEMLGVQSSAHGPKKPVSVTYLDPEHPITAGLGDWVTIDEELYNNVRVFGATTALAKGDQTQPPSKKMLRADPNAKSKEATAVVAWTNQYGPNKTRVFCTTLGHFNETVEDDRYMDLVCRGLLWATGNLSPDGTPVFGYAK